MCSSQSASFPESSLGENRDEGTRRPGSLGLAHARAIALSSPNEKQADVARHPAGKVKNAGRKMKTLRLQIVAPAQEDLPRLATQRGWPIRIGRINSTAAIAAELTREAQKHEFLQSLLGGSARSVNECAPAFLGYMLADQLRRLALSLLLCAVTSRCCRMAYGSVA